MEPRRAILAAIRNPGRSGAALLAVFGLTDLAVFAWTWWGSLGAGSRGTSFYSLYTGPALLHAVGPDSVYDPRAQEHLQRLLTAGWPGHAAYLPYVHPPFLTVLAAPLATFSLAGAYRLTAVVNVALAVAAGLVLVKAAGLQGRPALLAGLALLCALPIQLVMLEGQTDLLMLLALGSAALFWQRGRQGLAGVLVGLAMLKPQLLLVLPLFFLARRAWRALLGLLAGAAALVALSIPITGAAAWRDYGSWLLPWLSGAPAFNNETAYSLRRLLETAPGGRPMAVLLLLVGLAAAAVALSWRPHRPRLDFAVAVAAAVVLSPYANLHDLSLLALPAILAGGLLRSGSLRWPALAGPVLLSAYVLLEATLVLGAAAAAIAAFVIAAYLWAERLAVRADPVPLGESSLSGARARRVVVLPAYRAEKTLRDVIEQIPPGEVDRILLVDDASSDRTAELALELGIDVIKHPRNLGYGGNQKTCYANALLMGAEVVVMLHPDGQYDPSLVPALCRAVEEGRGDIVLGSRWLGLDPARAGMPWWKRVGNRGLTWTENRVLGLDLSEYHTGYRAYSRRFLQVLPFAYNSDDFVFDTQVLVQAAAFGFRIAEVPAVGRYFDDMSSIGFRTSVEYGVQTLLALGQYLLHRSGLSCRWLRPNGGSRQPAPIEAAAVTLRA